MIKQLTESQQKYLDIIKRYIDINRFSPSLKDIADRYGSTVCAARNALNILKKKGYIDKSNIPRSIVILKKDKL